MAKIITNDITDAQTGILDIDKLVKKLGDHAPSPIRKEEADQDINFTYARSVLSAAKSNAHLFSREEIGHILAADYLMQAMAKHEENEMPALGVDADEETPTLPKMDPKLDAALKVVAAVVKNSGSYQEALRAGVIALESCIPYVGGIIAAITSIFWPQTKTSVWDQVKDQVKKLVKNAIFQNEFDIVKSQITAVQISLTQYVNSPSNIEQGNILTATMVLLNSLYERVNQSKDRHMLIGLMVPIGALHLTVLSERYNHYKVLFGEDDRSEALKELQSTYTQYKVFFETVYGEWKDWRGSELELFYNVNKQMFYETYSYGVNDGLDQYNFVYTVANRQRAVEYKTLALRKCIAELADVLSPTQMYSIYFKNTEITVSPILPQLDKLVLGPYYWTILPGTGNFGLTITRDFTADMPGTEVNKIIIQAGNSIDGLQFGYPEGYGTLVSGGGGERFELDLNGKQCIGALIDYSSGIAFKLQFLFADGSKSPVYGNKGGWSPIASVDATVGGSYKLASGNFALGSGPSGTQGITGVVFAFNRV